MSAGKNEIEVKFWLNDPAAYVQRLQAAGAVQDHPRVLESNLRYDTPDGSLSQARRVLRLRRDFKVWLTYKDPAQASGDASIRREIQFEASDYEEARAFLEALGYQVVVMYEKYRTGYSLDGVLITLDEMPFGVLTELEGPDVPTLQQTARKLGLDWEARSLASYIQLFEDLRRSQGLQARQLSFAEFEGLRFSAEQLGMRAADR